MSVGIDCRCRRSDKDKGRKDKGGREREGTTSTDSRLWEKPKAKTKPRSDKGKRLDGVVVESEEMDLLVRPCVRLPDAACCGDGEVSSAPDVMLHDRSSFQAWYLYLIFASRGGKM